MKVRSAVILSVARELLAELDAEIARDERNIPSHDDGAAHARKEGHGNVAAARADQAARCRARVVLNGRMAKALVRERRKSEEA